MSALVLLVLVVAGGVLVERHIINPRYLRRQQAQTRADLKRTRHLSQMEALRLNPERTCTCTAHSTRGADPGCLKCGGRGMA